MGTGGLCPRAIFVPPSKTAARSAVQQTNLSKRDLNMDHLGIVIVRQQPVECNCIASEGTREQDFRLPFAGNEEFTIEAVDARPALRGRW